MYSTHLNKPFGSVQLLSLLAVFGVAQSPTAFASDSEVVAPIYRSESCGQQRWIGGQPSWLDQLILFNDGGTGASLSSLTSPVCENGGQPSWLDQLILVNESGAGAPLRSMTISVCYDGCHVQNRCVGQGGAEDCDCLAPGDLPFDASFQLYDGNPCDGGVQIAGAGGTVTITAGMILDAQIGDGQLDCFDLTVSIDPKVMIPHEVWVEASFGHDDAWPVMGSTAVEDTSPLSGLNDGVNCTTFCDQGEPQCQNDPDGCDWFLTQLDSNAEFFFKLQPRSGGAGTVVGQEIILANGGVRVDFDIFVTDFDPQQTGTLIQAWQSGVDSSGYTSGLQGTLTPLTIPCVVGICSAPPVNAGNLCKSGSDCDDVVLCTAPPANVGNVCTDNADCDTNPGDGDGVCNDGDGECNTNQPSDQCIAANLGMGDGSSCNSLKSACEAGYIDCARADFLLGCNAISACNVSTKDYVCAAVFCFGGNGTTKADAYLWSLALDVSPEARGTFTIDLKMPGNLLFNTNAQFLPFAGVVPGQVTIPAGSCCYDLDSQTPACAEALLPEECDALPGPRIYNQNGICDGTCTAGRCCYDLFSATPGCADSLQFEECETLPGPRSFVGGAVCDGSCTTILRGRCCYDLDSAPACADLLPLDECDALPGPTTWLQDGACDGTCTTCLPSSPPAVEMIGFEVVAKNRFISVEVVDPGRLQTLRVTAVSLQPPYDAWNGQQWFAGTPIQVCENSGQGLGVPIEDCGPAPGAGRRWFWAVPLVCNEALAHYADWSSMGLVHLYHEGIVPSRLVAGGGAISIPSVYDVQVIDRNCDSGNAGNFSDPLSITQSTWCDVVKDCMECPCAVPDLRVDIVTDTISIIQKFANAFCAPPSTRVDVEPALLDFKIGIVDVSLTALAFSGVNYPYIPGDPCE